MIKPQKWIARKRDHSKNTLRLFREIEKGSAKPESSALQPSFEDEEEFHRNHLWRRE